jgi:hypothetical protein
VDTQNDFPWMFIFPYTRFVDDLEKMKNAILGSAYEII